MPIDANHRYTSKELLEDKEIRLLSDEELQKIMYTQVSSSLADSFGTSTVEQVKNLKKIWAKEDLLKRDPISFLMNKIGYEI